MVGGDEGRKGGMSGRRAVVWAEGPTFSFRAERGRAGGKPGDRALGCKIPPLARPRAPTSFSPNLLLPPPDLIRLATTLAATLRTPAHPLLLGRLTRTLSIPAQEPPRTTSPRPGTSTSPHSPPSPLPLPSARTHVELAQQVDGLGLGPAPARQAVQAQLERYVGQLVRRRGRARHERAVRRGWPVLGRRRQAPGSSVRVRPVVVAQAPEVVGALRVVLDAVVVARAARGPAVEPRRLDVDDREAARARRAPSVAPRALHPHRRRPAAWRAAARPARMRQDGDRQRPGRSAFSLVAWWLQRPRTFFERSR